MSDKIDKTKEVISNLHTVSKLSRSTINGVIFSLSEYISSTNDNYYYNKTYLNDYIQQYSTYIKTFNFIEQQINDICEKINTNHNELLLIVEYLKMSFIIDKTFKISMDEKSNVLSVIPIEINAKCIENKFIFVEITYSYDELKPIKDYKTYKNMIEFKSEILKIIKGLEDEDEVNDEN